MPRQLPWASKSGGSRAQAKPASLRKAAKARTTTAIDYDFFDDTVPAGSSKSRGSPNESDDDLPKDALRKKRQGSSSPPAVDDLEAPVIELMDKDASKFDLRDDEWMMVEDEFLDTAKLFTRHLHIAEYEKLKTIIEEKKKEAAYFARPVVANAKRSTSGEMKEKARVQELKQKKAIRDVFASQEEHDNKDERTNLASSSMASRHAATTVSKPTPGKYAGQESDNDSDDLDALRPSIKPARRATTTPTPVRKSSLADGQKSASSPAPNRNPTFAKPAPPTPAAKSRSRISRATPFDMLDDLVPTKKSKTLSEASPEPTVGSQRSSRASTVGKLSQSFASAEDRREAKIGRSTASFDEIACIRDQGSDDNSGISKETLERIAKRKAEREKDDKERKRKAAKLDDTPTFLF